MCGCCRCNVVCLIGKLARVHYCFVFPSASTPKNYQECAENPGMEKELGLLGKHDEKPKRVGGTYVICPLPSEGLKGAHGNV